MNLHFGIADCQRSQSPGALVFGKVIGRLDAFNPQRFGQIKIEQPIQLGSCCPCITLKHTHPRRARGNQYLRRIQQGFQLGKA